MILGFYFVGDGKPSIVKKEYDQKRFPKHILRIYLCCCWHFSHPKPQMHSLHPGKKSSLNTSSIIVLSSSDFLHDLLTVLLIEHWVAFLFYFLFICFSSRLKIQKKKKTCDCVLGFYVLNDFPHVCIVGMLNNANYWWCNGYDMILKGLSHLQRSKLGERESFFLVKSKKIWTHPRVTNSDQRGRNSSYHEPPVFPSIPMGQHFLWRLYMKKEGKTPGTLLSI